MAIKVCVAGTTGWTGSVVARHLLASDDFDVVGAIARQTAGQDLGEVLGLAASGRAGQALLAAGCPVPAVVGDHRLRERIEG